jgi:alpha-L-rhamnosidase
MIRFLPLLALLSILVGCDNSSINNPEPLFSGAKWISSANDEVIPDSAMYDDHQAPIFRKEFDLKKLPEDARIAVTAAGYNTVWINGKKVGDQELSPAWTNYSKRIYYRVFDVTDLLIKGTNVIAVELGNGWYNLLPLRMWGHRNLRESVPTGKPRFIVDLRMSTKGKDQGRIVSDESWSSSLGEITRNSIYLGEWHDMRLFQKDWRIPDFEENGWGKASIIESPGGNLELADFPPIRKTESLTAVSIWPVGDGKLLVDFGQNMAGRFSYSGPVTPGDSIFFRMGERIWEDSTLNPMTAVAGQIKRKGVGGPGAPDIAEQLDVFIPNSESDTFEPRYSFHGFRYIEISGLNADQANSLAKEHFTAYRMGTDLEKISSLEANLNWINKLQTMTEWTLTSNVFSVASDCPAREKFGYGGDLSATAETWLYNYDAKSIFIKFVRDWVDAMKPEGFVDTAPFVGIEYCGIAWESAYLIIQDELFKFYGDLDLLKEWYIPNQEWFTKAQKLCGMDLVRSGLADHESLLPVPVELVGSLSYFQCQRIMQKFAGLNGDAEKEKEYKEFADQYYYMLVDSLWRNPSIEIKNVQTWISGLLRFDIIPSEDIQEAVNMLVDDITSRGVQLTTGIFGTPWMLEVLSKYGHVQLAYDIASRKDYPGWRHMIDNGATTIWETWKESDNTFSQNHPMFSTVSAFFHRWIGGLDPVDGGFTRIMVHPAPVKGIDSFSVSRSVKNQELSLSWKRTKTQVVFEMRVPEGVEVIWVPQLLLPNQLESIQGPDGKLSTSDKPQIIFNDPGSFKLIYNI